MVWPSGAYLRFMSRPVIASSPPAAAGGAAMRELPRSSTVSSRSSSGLKRAEAVSASIC